MAAIDGDQGSSVTLILYSIDKDWWKGTEPFLNLLAAAAQLSSFTHVELAIGEDSGSHGEMVNVLRIFNDSQGVELTNRTGKNPNYQYVQIGCSRKATQAMLSWASRQVGKPFSSSGMARSILWPRTSTGDSWYCASISNPYPHIPYIPYIYIILVSFPDQPPDLLSLYAFHLKRTSSSR